MIMMGLFLCGGIYVEVNYKACLIEKEYITKTKFCCTTYSIQAYVFSVIFFLSYHEAAFCGIVCMVLLELDNRMCVCVLHTMQVVIYVM